MKEVVNILPSAALTATGATAAFVTPPGANSVSVQVSVTAVSGTTPSATFSLEWSEGGGLWHKADPADDFAAITAVGSVVKSFTPKGSLLRLAYTITGTTPSLTTQAVAVAWGPPS